jgi:FAD/FMN-containing dehydrogenase
MDDVTQDITRRTFSGLALGTVATSALAMAGCARGPKSLAAADVAVLEKALGHRVMTPASGAAYDGARVIWNGRFDRHPAIIAPCLNAKDVAQCVAFARDHDLALSVRSGGHSPAGLAMNDGGLVIDLSGMKAVKVDPATRRVTVQPGALAGEVELATQVHKLVVPVAAYPGVGMGGMTLGGGQGWFHEFGMTSDNILAAEMVLADGRIVRVDSANEPDLFWAIRGGGGNFGVVTSFDLQAHPLPDIMLGMFAYPLPFAKDMGAKWRAHALAAAPDYASALIFARQPVPSIALAVKTGRPQAAAKEEFDKILRFATPVQHMVKSVSLSELGSMAAAGIGGGTRYFALSHYLKDVTPAFFDLAMAASNAAPTPFATIIANPICTTVAAVPVDATAFPHRGCRFSVYAEARWSDAKDDQANIAWVKDWWAKTLPLATGEVYANYNSETGDDMARRAYGPNYPRLAQIKRRYDPGNVFSSTVNIKPA